MSEHCDSAAEIKTSIGGAQMKCPYCAEEVKDEAVVCKHCHRDLTSVRLNSLEIDVKKRLDELTDELQALKIRLASLESMLNSGLPLSQKTTDSPSFFWISYPITLLIGIILPMACIGSFYVTYNAVMILLPFLIWTAIGSWPGFADPKRSVKRYALLALGIAVFSFFGILTIIVKAKLGWDLLQAADAAIFHFQEWGTETLWLFFAPFFLVILGGFVGEWLASKRPSGKKLGYPRELAKQFIKFSPQRDRTSVNIDNLTKTLTALAPLIAAIGGIVVPIITLLFSKR